MAVEPVTSHRTGLYLATNWKTSSFLKSCLGFHWEEASEVSDAALLWSEGCFSLAWRTYFAYSHNLTSKHSLIRCGLIKNMEKHILRQLWHTAPQLNRKKAIRAGCGKYLEHMWTLLPVQLFSLLGSKLKFFLIISLSHQYKMWLPSL